MPDYIEIIITVEGEDQKDLLIARLADIGFEGFEENRKLLMAYIPEHDFNHNQAAINAILESGGLRYSKSVIKQKNWNEEWESGFEPVIVDTFCAVRASFHAPVSGVRHEVIITPKMSFGTGHHATTYMMIEAMSSIDFKDRKVIDFGTGTGVLAILAEKLGATEIVAIDVDDWSIENAKENVQINTCKAISLFQANSLEAASKADILLANINRNVITDHLQSMKEHLQPRGALVLSGLLAGDLEHITNLVMGEGLMVNSVIERNSWICLHIINE